MIVVDTNIIAYLYLEGEYTEKAEAILLRDPEWVAPLLWRSELRNVLALYIRKKIFTYQTAVEIMEQAELLMEGKEYTVTSANILELVNHSTCSAYDCEFIFLAKELKVPLLTEDKKILSSFPKNTISLNSFLKNDD